MRSHLKGVDGGAIEARKRVGADRPVLHVKVHDGSAKRQGARRDVNLWWKDGKGKKNVGAGTAELLHRPTVLPSEEVTVRRAEPSGTHQWHRCGGNVSKT